MKHILIISGGDFAAKVIRLINRIGGYVVVGYTDIVDRGSLFEVKYLGTDSEIPGLIKFRTPSEVEGMPRDHNTLCVFRYFFMFFGIFRHSLSHLEPQI